MDEDRPDIPEDGTEAEDNWEPHPQLSTGAALAILVAGIVAVALAIYFGVAQTVAGLFIVLGIPLALAWFTWTLFLRRLWRIRRIRGARERRELLEAALRDKKTNHEGN